jgi:hypothetical protein
MMMALGSVATFNEDIYRTLEQTFTPEGLTVERITDGSTTIGVMFIRTGDDTHRWAYYFPAPIHLSLPGGALDRAKLIRLVRGAPVEMDRIAARLSTMEETTDSAEETDMAESIRSVSFVNDTTGNRSVLRVGDRWTLTVTGAPNSDVVIVGGSGGRTDRNTMGRTNAAGVWTTSGSPGPAEIGNWSQQIFVGGALAGTLVFQVVAASATPDNPPANRSVPEILAEQAGKLGIPSSWTDWATANTWLLVGGAAAVLFFMTRKEK